MRLSEAAKETGQDVEHERLFSPEITIDVPGYVYIYLSNENETPIDVYFDEFQVEHVKSPVVQMSDYYPFGLTFNSYQRENSVAQRWKFQGQEHIDDLGLNWDSFKWRNHQPDIGRFFNIDPLAEDYYYNSPYAFSENKVISHIEVEGLESLFVVGIVNDVMTRKAISESIANKKHIEARGVAEKLGGIHNGKADAWRHAAWSKESSEAVGKTWTMLFGIAHEIGNIMQGSEIEEVIMDLTNNKKGREAANTDADLVQKAENGELETINPKNEVDYTDSNDSGDSGVQDSRSPNESNVELRDDKHQRY